MLKKKVTDVFLVFLSIFIFVLCFWTVLQLVYFFSSHTALNGGNVENLKIMKPSDSYWIPFIVDCVLLALFVAQHHFQASRSVRNSCDFSYMMVTERLLYNVGTCLTLQILMRGWQPIHSVKIWLVPTSQDFVSWWVFTTVHFIAWLIIYGGCLIMDMPELMGIKQVYYAVQSWPHPLLQKSDNLQRLYSHMRHPSFSAIAVILFVHPIMELDRFILASVLTLFMFFCFKVDEHDYLYQKKQRRQKEIAFKSYCQNS